MRWLVADTLACPEQWFGSHLSAYSHFLREYGETVYTCCLNLTIPEATMGEGSAFPAADVVFVLDRYKRVAEWSSVALLAGAKFIAQCAAITNPLPWEVRKPDGSPAYDLVLSSIPWMVDAARAAGFRAEYQSLCFDLRARSCMMGVKRDIDCLFVGSTGSNHVRRTQLLDDLKDVVTVLPPVFGREYFKTLARAKVVLNVHAEWAHGAANAMRLTEAAGMGCVVVSDGQPVDSDREWWWRPDGDRACEWREQIEFCLRDPEGCAITSADVLASETYECADRVPRLISLARDL